MASADYWQVCRVPEDLQGEMMKSQNAQILALHRGGFSGAFNPGIPTTFVPVRILFRLD